MLCTAPFKASVRPIAAGSPPGWRRQRASLMTAA
jgi:hypothetical protein